MIMGLRRYDVCMELLLIALAAAAASAATLISGFGLSTALVPVFALYFTLPLAIGAVAVVHLQHIQPHLIRLHMFKVRSLP